jgi:hypothetical protein
MLADETGALTRVPGGFYCPATRPDPVFTKRTVNSLERDGLVRLDAPLCTTRADLTDEGRAIATQLLEAEQAKDGAA